MLKGMVLGVALTLTVALVGAYSLVRSGPIPANADATPGWLETWMARTSLDVYSARVLARDGFDCRSVSVFLSHFLWALSPARHV